MSVLNITPFSELITERLLLRQLDLKDAYDIMLLRSDDVVNQYLNRQGKITIDEAKGFIEKIRNGIINNEWFYWAIVFKNTDNLIGTICFWNIDFENSIGEIGYELKLEFHGKGIMQEAFLSVVNYGIHNLKFKVITAFPRKDNIKSIKLLEKNGFIIDEYNKFSNNRDSEEFACYYYENNS